MLTCAITHCCVLAGNPLDFKWDLEWQYEEVASPSHSALVEGADRIMADIDEGWVPPTLGVVKRTADMSGLEKGRFVVVLTDTEDEYTFKEEGQLLWLGRVSHPST